MSDAREGAEQMAGLTSANSPLLQLLVAVRENTRLISIADELPSVTTTVGTQGGTLTAVAGAVVAKGTEVLASTVPDTSKKDLQRQFEPLHRLLDDKDAPTASLTPLLVGLTDVQLQMAVLARASAPDQAAYEMARLRISGQRDALSHLRQAAQRLPRPLNGWFNTLTEDTWGLVLNDSYQFLNKRYQHELYRFYARALKQRYPFDAHSSSDVALNDFREFFKAQGLADQFFDTWMKPFVSRDAGSYRLRSMDGKSLPMSRVYFEQMATAQVIRQGFLHKIHPSRRCSSPSSLTAWTPT